MSSLVLRRVFSVFAANTHNTHTRTHTRTNANKVIANWIREALGAASPTNEVVF